MDKKAVLIINLGTPRSTKTRDIYDFLKEFLLDKRVIDLPYLLRQLLVRGLILPFRPRKVAKDYQAIWTQAGSPLMVTTKQLCAQLQEALGETYDVQMAMRYAQYSIEEALQYFWEMQQTEILIIPLFPQYAVASTGSVLAECYKAATKYFSPPALSIIKDFFSHKLFIQAQGELIKKAIKENNSSLLITSYHGIPVRHLTKTGCKKAERCQKGSCPKLSSTHRDCYRAQCFETTRLLCENLDSPIETLVTFQSRLGKTPWIKPYLDEELTRIAPQYQNQNITIVCPSFTSDCLETLEEIGSEAKEQWYALTKGTLNLAPCVNVHPLFIACLKEIVTDFYGKSSQHYSLNA